MARRVAGITLIETTIALALLAIAFLALIQSMFSASSLSVASTEDQEAILFAQNKVEEIVSAFNGGSSGLPPSGPSPWSNFLSTYSATGTSYTNASPSFTYLNGSSSDLVYTNMYPTTSYTVPTTFGNNTTVAAGWGSSVVGGYLGTSTDLATERVSRLNGSSFSLRVHFLSEYEYSQQTGINDQLDLVSGHTAAATPATNVPSPATQVVNGVSLWTFVNSYYSYFPFTVTVSWKPLSSQVDSPNLPTKSKTIMGVAVPAAGRAGSPRHS
ncbi:MAG TPA: hypothetical protein VFF73_36330 [Planctomycetota bacterium]|nr:hypothetical protein [Planctomycetota bacterium]